MADLAISVAIPCYNGAAFVGSAIESILAQRRSAGQIIVVDDGSTDDSVDVIGGYSVTLVQHATNQGLAHARNSAIEAASGDILVFVDVDALADPTLLAVLAAGYSDDSIGGVGGQGIESNIRSLADRWRRAHATQGHGSRKKLVEFLPGLCMSYRLKLLRELGGFNTRFWTNGEDMDMGARVRKAGYDILYLPAAKVYHQRTDDVHSLKRTMANWYKASYQVKRINGDPVWKQYAGIMRRLVTAPLHDLFIEHDIQLARLSWEIGWEKYKAVRTAAAQFETK